MIDNFEYCRLIRIMGVTALLLSAIVVHIYATEHNFTLTTESYEAMDGEFYEDYDEDYSRNYSDTPSVNYSIGELPELMIGMVNVIKEIILQPCNSTDLDSVECYKTLDDTYNISDEAVIFLKGPLVTHFMPSFYILVILISLPLNALALVTFTCRIREKKPAVIYMSHLACVDLLFALLLPLKIHYQLNSSDWVFGEVACRVVTAAYYCYMYCSILLMMCMSVDRLLAVVFPIKTLTWRSTSKASLVCTLAWLLALAGTAPLLAITQTYKIKDVGVTCHDILHHTHLYAYTFSILSCVYFFLPLIVTLVSYSTIIHVLRNKSNLLTPSSSSSSDKRRRAVIITIAVLTEFVVCFAPTNGILLYHCVRLVTVGSTDEGKYHLLAVCLGSTSVFLDPLLYYYGSSQCREKISSMFWWRKTKGTIKQSNTKSSQLQFINSDSN